jgi:uncharacterized Zn finger protein
MDDYEGMDTDDIVMEELEACDWDMSEDSMENIAKKLRNKFESHDEALEYVYSITSSMLDNIK